MYSADSLNLLCFEFGFKKKKPEAYLVMITMTNNDKVGFPGHNG